MKNTALDSIGYLRMNHPALTSLKEPMTKYPNIAHRRSKRKSKQVSRSNLSESRLSLSFLKLRKPAQTMLTASTRVSLPLREEKRSKVCHPSLFSMSKELSSSDMTKASAF